MEDYDDFVGWLMPSIFFDQQAKLTGLRLHTLQPLIMDKLLAQGVTPDKRCGREETQDVSTELRNCQVMCFFFDFLG